MKTHLASCPGSPSLYQRHAPTKSVKAGAPEILGWRNLAISHCWDDNTVMGFPTSRDQLPKVDDAVQDLPIDCRKSLHGHCFHPSGKYLILDLLPRETITAAPFFENACSLVYFFKLFHYCVFALQLETALRCIMRGRLANPHAGEQRHFAAYHCTNSCLLKYEPLFCNTVPPSLSEALRLKSSASS